MGRKTPIPPDLSHLRGEVRLERRLTASHRIIEVTVHGASAENVRLDKLLTEVCPGLTRSLFQLWIGRGDVTVNGRVAQASHRIKIGDHIHLKALLPANPDDLDQNADDLEILYAEDDFLVVNKPPGQLVHQAGKVFHGTLLGLVQAYLKAQGRDPKEARLVNRIDRETSGIVLVGLTGEAQRKLSMALERRDVEKTYLALCHGTPNPAHGHWKDPIGPGLEDTPKRMVRADGQACHTEYVIEAEHEAISRLRITLHTGRQHQIRLHASHNGHPLVGDWVYGSACEGLPGQALHAHRIAFQHPHKPKEHIVVESPLPVAIQTIWDQAAQGIFPIPRELTDVEKGRLKDPEDEQRRRRLPKWLSEAETQQIRDEMRNK